MNSTLEKNTLNKLAGYNASAMVQPADQAGDDSLPAALSAKFQSLKM